MIYWLFQMVTVFERGLVLYGVKGGRGRGRGWRIEWRWRRDRELGAAEAIAWAMLRDKFYLMKNI